MRKIFVAVLSILVGAVAIADTVVGDGFLLYDPTNGTIAYQMNTSTRKLEGQNGWGFVISGSDVTGLGANPTATVGLTAVNGTATTFMRSDAAPAHGDTSSQASVNNSGATVIQDVTLDTVGHVTGLGSVEVLTAIPTAIPVTKLLSDTGVSVRNAADSAAAPTQASEFYFADGSYLYGDGANGGYFDSVGVLLPWSASKFLSTLIESGGAGTNLTLDANSAGAGTISLGVAGDSDLVSVPYGYFLTGNASGFFFKNAANTDYVPILAGSIYNKGGVIYHAANGVSITQSSYGDVAVARGQTVLLTADAAVQFGSIVMVDAGTDNRFDANTADGDLPIGIYAGAQAAQGASAAGTSYHVAVGGIAYVLPMFEAAPVRGYLAYQSASVAGRASFASATTGIGAGKKVGRVLFSEAEYTWNYSTGVNYTTNVITLSAAPGWAVNDPVVYYKDASATAMGGLTDGNVYWIKTISGADITLAATLGGTAIDLSANSEDGAQYLMRLPKCVVQLN